MKKNKIVVIVLLFSLMLSNSVFATEQFCDLILYKGQTYEILNYVYPLESYFNESNPRPVPMGLGFLRKEALCSACWRGYIATWKIEEGILYLIKLEDGSCDLQNKRDLDISKIFPEQQLPIKAEWFNGSIDFYLETESYNPYELKGGETFNAKQLYLTIENGVIQKEEIVNTKISPMPLLAW